MDQTDRPLPTDATLAFRKRVTELALRNNRFRKLNTHAQSVIEAALAEYHAPKGGDPRKRPHETLVRLGEDKGLAVAQLQRLNRLLGTLMGTGFDLALKELSKPMSQPSTGEMQSDRAAEPEPIDLDEARKRLRDQMHAPGRRTRAGGTKAAEGNTAS